jgi:hypothetical protein
MHKTVMKIALHKRTRIHDGCAEASKHQRKSQDSRLREFHPMKPLLLIGVKLSACTAFSI